MYRRSRGSFSPLLHPLRAQGLPWLDFASITFTYLPLTYVLAERPTGDIIPGRTFKAERGPAPTADDLKDGEILVESLYLSLDPAMRGWLNGTSARARARLWPYEA